jgi:ribonuclease HI
MDKVQKIAAEIAQLGPEDKQLLFGLLFARGDLPVRNARSGLGHSPAQAESESGTAKQAYAPDYVLVFDGGSKGNPGQGYGSYAITRVQDGARRLERLSFGDGYTNNEAEYDALIAALRDLLGRIEDAERQPQEFALEIRGDSALVINQLRGTWKAKEARMRKRRDQCLRLLRQFGVVVFKTQPREESVRILGH